MAMLKGMATETSPSICTGGWMNIPKWMSSGLMPRLGEVAVDVGWWLAPNGFRILSNFGRDGLQSQSHGHIHVIGGTHLGEYA